MRGQFFYQLLGNLGSKLILACVVTAGVALAAPTFAFTEPTEAPPGGNAAAPLNTSFTSQVKAGPLTLQGGLSVSQGLTVSGGDRTIQVTCTGTRCFDLDRVTATGGFVWQTLRNAGNEKWWIRSDSNNDYLGFDAKGTDTGDVGVGTILRLNQNGNVAISGGVQLNPDAAFLVSKNSSTDPNGSPSNIVDVRGRSSDGGSALYLQQENVNAFAAFVSGATYIFSNSAVLPTLGVTNTNPASSARAAFFTGTVEISGQLCLNGVCQTAWPSGSGPGSEFWTRNTSSLIVSPSQNVDNDKVAIGGNTSTTAEFFFDPAAAGGGGQLVLGPNPPAGGGGDPPLDISSTGSGWSRFVSAATQPFKTNVALATIVQPATSDRLVVRNGVIVVQNKPWSGSYENLEIGGNGKDITGTGPIVLRPSLVATGVSAQIENIFGGARVAAPNVTGNRLVASSFSLDPVGGGNNDIDDAAPGPRLLVHQGLFSAGNSNDAAAIFANSPAGASGLYVEQQNASSAWAAFFSGSGRFENGTNTRAALEVFNSSTSSSLLATQANTAGWAGTFSGRVSVNNGTAVTNALEVRNNAPGNVAAVFAEQLDGNSFAGKFLGRVLVQNQPLQAFLNIRSLISGGSPGSGILLGDDGLTAVSRGTLMSIWETNGWTDAFNCADDISSGGDTTASNQTYTRLRPSASCPGGDTAHVILPSDVIHSLPPGTYNGTFRLRARTSTAFNVTISVGGYSRTITAGEFSSALVTQWKSFTVKFNRDAAIAVKPSVTMLSSMPPGSFVDIDTFMVTPDLETGVPANQSAF